MAGRNSWTLPGNGILGGVTLGSGISRLDDPNSEYETPWAQALREAIEKQPGGDVDRLVTLAEQVRGGAIPKGPHEVLGDVGKSIIQHYADYFDPWTRDEQGRRVIDTPAAYTPNEAMKLPETQKP